MKFAKDFSQDLVPEWRIKYLEYKVGKKKVKAVAKALNKINSTPHHSGNSDTPARTTGPRSWLFNSASPPLDPVAASGEEEGLSEALWNARAQHRIAANTAANSGSTHASQAARALNETSTRGSPLHIRQDADAERQPLQPANGRTGRGQANSINYGSILQTPASHSVPVGPPSLELPDPALSPSVTVDSGRGAGANSAMPELRRVSTSAGDAYEVGRTHTPSKLSSTLLPKNRNIFRPRRTFSTPQGGINHRSPMKRMFSFGRHVDGARVADVPMESYREFDIRQADFFAWLDRELNKIETFYAEKENDAEKRLQLLKEQLHIMRDRRLQEVIAEQHTTTNGNGHGKAPKDQAEPPTWKGKNGNFGKPSKAPTWLREAEDRLGFGPHRFGKNSEALFRMALESPDNRTAEGHGADRGPHEDSYRYRDFARHKNRSEVSYRDAKRKLKLALQEYYRGLELLKSYALLNRTAFRKINKKYDKAVQARPPLKYMSDSVNKSWFVQSEKVDSLLVSVEDLYARYFERGNHKVAVGKLRSKSDKNSYTGSVFRNGLFLAAGAVFGIEGLIDASRILDNGNDQIKSRTSFLLQLYGGFFLADFLFLLFVLVCRMWVRSKINYVFIFEFDTRHNLDWRQLGELPSMFMFFLGICIWLNFQQFGNENHTFFIWWPVILIGATVAVMFFPFKGFYHRSRAWFLHSNWRLLCAYWYPVEFRDFFLGDMFCSLTYAMGNIEVFFCLYANNWNDTDQCKSSSSMVLGFLSALPGIWRALQCARRYKDTRNWFPHLVNFGKYTATCLFYMSLSLWRIRQTHHYEALFISLATINSCYVTAWDLIMDWSLLIGSKNPQYPLLRKQLGYKRVWMYYVAMIIDPIIRFNWVLYFLVDQETQHSAVLSFIIALTEICRRAMWTIFRVENEHCTNVGRFRASRDVPLPYETPSTRETIPEERPSTDESSPSQSTPLHDPEQGVTTSSSPSISPQLRRRRTLPPSIPNTPSSFGRGLQRMGTIITNAHAQDFERKRKLLVNDHDDRDGRMEANSSDEDEDEEEENEAIRQERAEIDEAENILDRHRSATASGSGQ